MQRFMMGIAALTLVFISALPASSSARTATSSSTATVAAPQGFGDRQNTKAWAMIWWKNNLYVGTDRAMTCVNDATAVYQKVPGAVYPDPDPDVSCTPSPNDLPLQAEIWRWTPPPTCVPGASSNCWVRVFQSPNDIPIPNAPGKFVARDIGFRTITAFTEADGTEALYIGGLDSRTFHGKNMPPPRILRSTDGLNWNPIPQAAGTFFGNTTAVGFRSMTVYNGRLYVVASTGLSGEGPVYVSSNPAGGNNNFQKLTPSKMPPIYELANYNGFLYLGSGGTTPFAVWKTTGIKPYTFTPVMTNGAYANPAPTTVVSVQIYNGMLYLGTSNPPSVYRIHQDDSWDLVVGNPTTVPSTGQTITPLSGIGSGFNWPENQHIWRLGVYNNQLYVGTYDESTQDRNEANHQDPAFQAQLGFDLYSTADGVNFQQLTITGYGDKFSYGVRQLVSTPYGLFLGSANPYYGLQIWQITG